MRWSGCWTTRGPALSRTSTLRKRDYLERAVRGGFPEAVRRSPRRRAAFFDSYLTSLIERDVKELAAIERQGDLRRLLALLAGRSGGLLVPATLARESGVPRTTLNRYLELLTAVFLIKQIPAWSAGQTHRAIGTPKLAFVDTGIACSLLGQDATRLGEPDGAAGPMMETFVLMEVARQLTWSSERARLYHYRTKDRVEVDVVLETPDGRVVAIEVKAGATIRAEDLAGLRHLASGSAHDSSRDTSSTPGSRPSPSETVCEHYPSTHCGNAPHRQCRAWHPIGSAAPAAEDPCPHRQPRLGRPRARPARTVAPARAARPDHQSPDGEACGPPFRDCRLPLPAAGRRRLVAHDVVDGGAAARVALPVLREKGVQVG